MKVWELQKILETVNPNAYVMSSYLLNFSFRGEIARAWDLSADWEGNGKIYGFDEWSKAQLDKLRLDQVFVETEKKGLLE